MAIISNALHPQVSTLLACNKSLLEQLDARVTKWNCDSVVGDIFVERVRKRAGGAPGPTHAPYLRQRRIVKASQAYRIQSKSFEVYTSFVNNFDRAMAYVRKLNTNEAFQKFVAVQQHECLRHRVKVEALTGERHDVSHAPPPISNWTRPQEAGCDSTTF